MFGRRKEKEGTTPSGNGLTDYDVYIMGKQEKALTVLAAAIVLFGVG